MSENAPQAERKNKSDAEIAAQVTRIIDKLADRTIGMLGGTASYQQVQDVKKSRDRLISNNVRDGNISYTVNTFPEIDNDGSPHWSGSIRNNAIALHVTDEVGIDYTLVAGEAPGPVGGSPRANHELIVGKQRTNDESDSLYARVGVMGDQVYSGTSRTGVDGIRKDINILDRGQKIRVAARAAGKIRSETSRKITERKQKSVKRSEQVLNELGI